MAYDLYDFTETLAVSPIEPDLVAECTLGFGVQGDYAEWQGGFVCRLVDGRWLFIFGWCDTTGWGCQDGADWAIFDFEPLDSELKDAWAEYMGWGTIPLDDADPHPADINIWLKEQHARAKA